MNRRDLIERSLAALSIPPADLSRLADEIEAHREGEELPPVDLQAGDILVVHAGYPGYPGGLTKTAMERIKGTVSKVLPESVKLIVMADQSPLILSDNGGVTLVPTGVPMFRFQRIRFHG